MNSGIRVVAIGNFDGAYLGHQRALQAEWGNGELAAVILWSHPLSVLAPGHVPHLLSNLPIRTDLLRQAGAREVRVVCFDKKVTAMGPTKFAERFVMPLVPWAVVVGKNSRFGYRASGGVGTLGELTAGRFEIWILELLAVNARITRSALIRETLDHSDMRLASQHLSRDSRLSSVVMVEDQRGRELGFPTTNLVVPMGLAIPADGVYTE